MRGGGWGGKAFLNGGEGSVLLTSESSPRLVVFVLWMVHDWPQELFVAVEDKPLPKQCPDLLRSRCKDLEILDITVQVQLLFSSPSNHSIPTLLRRTLNVPLLHGSIIMHSHHPSRHKTHPHDPSLRLQYPRKVHPRFHYTHAHLFLKHRTKR